MIPPPQSSGASALTASGATGGRGGLAQWPPPLAARDVPVPLTSQGFRALSPSFLDTDSVGEEGGGEGKEEGEGKQEGEEEPRMGSGVTPPPWAGPLPSPCSAPEAWGFHCWVGRVLPLPAPGVPEGLLTPRPPQAPR